MYCLYCGKELVKKTGKFCNNSCAAKYNNARRKLSDETKAKIAKSLSNTKKELRLKSKAKSGNPKTCIICGKEFVPERTKNYRFSLRKTCSNECYHLMMVQKGKEAAAKLIEEGRHKGWQSRNITSYAEQFWITVLNNNNIQYKREFYFEKYFLDFYIEKGNLKIDLEIDGKQHAYPERILHDKERDNFLTENNFLIYRVKWNDLKTENSKAEMQNKINAFLTWYNTL